MAVVVVDDESQVAGDCEGVGLGGGSGFEVVFVAGGIDSKQFDRTDVVRDEFSRPVAIGAVVEPRFFADQP